MEIEIEKFLPLHAYESKHDKTLDFANDFKLSLVGLSRWIYIGFKPKTTVPWCNEGLRSHDAL